ncbi:MAG: hypothetical protein ABI599_17305 [Flavobacteriales bacterium]
MLSRNLLAIPVVALPLLLGCLSDGTPELSDTPQKEITEKAPLDPAPSIPKTSKKSPLAQLMREMTAHADSARAALKRNDEPPPYPSAVSELLTAAATDSTLDRTSFNILAKDYLEKLKTFQAAPASSRAQAYNGIVQSCATCHGSLCPGPLMLIRKMYAPVPEKAP